MLKVRLTPGGVMSQFTMERARVLAQTLMEILSPYEEELIALERESPATGPLRRAVGIAIAEACYLITDQGMAEAEWTPDVDGPTRPKR